jgi:uncharacterized protein with FMN-binding domain
MKKIVMSIAAVAVGFLSVLGLHPSAHKQLLGGSLNKTNQQPTNNPPSSSPSQNTTPSGSSGNTGNTGNTGTTPTTVPPTNTPTIGTKTATGPIEQYGYGELAVKVTISSNKIKNVQVVDLQVADSYSGSIESQAAPMLRSQVLSAQSANIYGVSGATYTSQAYATSLQAALSKLSFQ